MGSSDAFMVGVDRRNPTSAATAETDAAGQTRASAFLTVQSFTNFAAAAGAISTAWLALQALDGQHFASRVWPFALCCAWLAASVVSSAQATRGRDGRDGSAMFWPSALFLGLMNALTLFAAVIGLAGVVPTG